jgi:hypothetical protein
MEGLSGAKLSNYAPILIAVVLVVAAIYVYSSSGVTSGSMVIPGIDNSAAQTATANANAAILAGNAAGQAAGFQQLVSLAGTEYNDNTSISLGQQQLYAVLAQQQSAASVASFQEQAAAAQASAQKEAAAAQVSAQKSSSMWSGLSSIFGSALSAFL